MERVAFVLEDSGEWVRCLLNPETLVMRRRAGIADLGRDRPVAGIDRSDDPVLFVGGGATEIQLDLLFDVGLSRTPPPDGDVRRLSDPLWYLSEHHGARSGRSPVVRLVWGKSWNLPGVITAAAQRLDDIQSDGVPRRNWMRVGFRRIHDEAARERPGDVDLTQRPRANAVSAGSGGDAGTANGDYVSGRRLDLVANRVYGDPGRWRDIAAANGVDDPIRIGAHRVLRVPGVGR